MLPPSNGNASLLWRLIVTDMPWRGRVGLRLAVYAPQRLVDTGPPRKPSVKGEADRKADCRHAQLLLRALVMKATQDGVSESRPLQGPTRDHLGSETLFSTWRRRSRERACSSAGQPLYSVAETARPGGLDSVQIEAWEHLKQNPGGIMVVAPRAARAAAEVLGLAVADRCRGQLRSLTTTRTRPREKRLERWGTSAG